MIVITTPTGDIGSRVLKHLLDAKCNLRLIARDATKLPDGLDTRVEVIEGSHSDADVLSRALKNTEAVFWLPPGNPVSRDADAAYVDFSKAFCDALPSSTVTHVVGISALGRGWSHPAGLVQASLQMDDMVGNTGVNYRALTCASLMDNILRQAASIHNDGMFYQPTPGSLKLPHVAKSDVASVAAKLLLSLDWQGVSEAPLYGPEDMSFDEMASVMSEVLGRTIRFEEISMEQFSDVLLATGVSKGMAQDYRLMFTAKNEGLDMVTEPATRSDTPTTFHVWCRQELLPAVTTS